MSTRNRYKLLRHGSGEAKVRPRAARSGRYVESENVLVPNLEEFGHRPFPEQGLQALAQLLQDPRWPRGTLNIYGLEGLLAALLILPLGLRPGAWLPLVWNDPGWKIPVALQDTERFGEFIESMLGFMRAIDKGLLETPPRFVSVLDVLDARRHPQPPHARRDWAMGFGRALSQSNCLKVLPDTATHEALYAIAMHANSSSANIRRVRRPPITLQQTVLTIALTRTSCGPLGPLPVLPTKPAIPFR